MEWSLGSGKKKYKVRVKGKTVQFGHVEYEHYKDKTPLGAWSHKDHGDKRRRSNYRKRHGAKGYQLVKYSPAWFSWHYLW